MDSQIGRLHSRAESLAAKFTQGDATNFIDEAIMLNREALECCPPGHCERSVSLTWLGIHLSVRYNRLRRIQDLDEAIVFGREALKLCPQGDPDRAVSLNNLAVHLSTRYSQHGGIETLDEAIVLDREALRFRPQGHPDRGISSNNLASNLLTRYKQLGGNQDLDEAIVLGRDALQLLQGHPNQAMLSNNLAVHLLTRFKQFGGIGDLDEAIVHGQKALRLRPRGHPDRSISLSNLAVRLSTRYDQLGGMQDLDEAIILDREALQLRPQGHPDRATSLNNFASHLSTRYKQLEGMQDLDEAIMLDREALQLCPRGHPGQATLLNNLALHLSTRYNQLKAMQDLDEAIILAREALQLCPQGHLVRGISLNNLASHLSTRYKQLGGIEALDEAIILDREALQLRSQGHPDRPTSLNSLAVRLSTRYNQSGRMQDLGEAFALCREALQLSPQGHPNRSIPLSNLASLLHTRFTRLSESKDKEELFSVYAELVHTPPMVSAPDLSAAKAWVRTAERFRHSSMLLAYETYLRLLAEYLASLPSLPQHLSVFKKATASLAVDAFSACLRHSVPARAVELLEQGRGVFWNQLTRLCSPLDEVIMSSPAGKLLADEFTRLTSLVRDALNSPGSDRHGRVWHLNLQLKTVVDSIRALSGLSRFLLPPYFSDLQLAANGGPVIIVNSSKYGCDAVVVLLDRDPVHIPLEIAREAVQDLSHEIRILCERAKTTDMTKYIKVFLRRLWDEVVSPIVDFLRTCIPTHSRIWWCPTADFSALPLHAAGAYRKGQLNLPYIYVSSYTPTLGALIRARRQSSSKPPRASKRFVAIGQANAIGQRQLPSVGSELANIGQRVDSLAMFTRIEGAESSISRVAEELGKNEWVHLACHGLAKQTKPFESAFALRDGHFTIERIIRCALKDPEFVYLSACHTTVGDEESPDEVIHLASAMQFVGFRSVIGTMWAVDDAETNKITSMFYSYVVDGAGRLDHTRAAYALNKTMRTVDVPLDQRILYIHLGA